MLTEEEIRLRLGLDDKPLDEGTRRAMAKLAQFGKESQKAFYENAEKPARAFRNVLRQITDQFPLLGGAARVALSPIGGALALAVSAAISFRQELQELNRTMDQIGNANSSRLGNIPKAIRAAALANSKAYRAGTAEMESFSNPLSDLVANANTAEERKAAMDLVSRARADTAQNVLGYNANYKGRDLMRTQISKANETIGGAESHLSAIQSIAEGLRHPGSLTQDVIDLLRSPKAQLLLSGIPGANQLVQLGTKGYNFAQDQRSKMLESLDVEIQNYKNQIEKESDRRNNLQNSLDEEDDAHQKNVTKLKALDDAYSQLNQQILNQSILQQTYNSQIAVLERNKSQAMAAQITPGLEELAGYKGPYAAIAREVLAGRDFAKRQMGFATRGEMLGINSEVRSAQYDLSHELRGATTYQQRQSALAKYSRRMETMLGGHITPENHLQSINDEIKKLNEHATNDGLIVRAADNS